MARKHIADQFAHQAPAIAMRKRNEIIHGAAAASTTCPKLNPPSWQGFCTGK